MNAALLSSKNMCWCTPQDFFDKLNAEFGFVLDPAATDKTAKCSLYYTPETDGLSQSWDRGGAVFCNPPYGREIGKWVQKAFEEARGGYPIVLLIRKSWDKTIPPPEYFRELERVSKAQVIWGGNYFVPYLEQGHKGWLVWDKGQHGLTMSDCELAYTSFDTPTRVFVCNRVELLNDGTIHPTQKPVKLYSWVLSLFARKGMKILDTHAGSGSSLIACYRQGGLDFVGFEIDEDYCRAANERLEQE